MTEVVDDDGRGDHGLPAADRHRRTQPTDTRHAAASVRLRRPTYWSGRRDLDSV